MCVCLFVWMCVCVRVRGRITGARTDVRPHPTWDDDLPRLERVSEPTENNEHFGRHGNQLCCNPAKAFVSSLNQQQLLHADVVDLDRLLL